MGESPAHSGLSAGHDEQEEFVLDGEVLDDLEEQDGQGYESSIDEDDDLDGHDGGQHDGENSRQPIVPANDDSIHSFEGHADAVLSVAWSPAHADLVATGGQDDTAFIWRVGQEAFEESGGATFELTGHTDTVSCVAFNSTGTLLATGGLDGLVKVWNALTGALVHTFEGGSALEWVVWHPRGDVVAGGTEDYMAFMWNAGTGSVMQVFAGHTGPVTAGAFTPDGKSLVTVGGEADCSLRMWNPKTGECSTTIQARHPFHEEGITSVAVHSDSAAVITGAQDGSVRLANLQTGRVVGALVGHEDSVEAVGFSAHVPFAASAGVDGKLIIWDLATMSQRNVCQHPDVITRMVWHPSQPVLLTACLDGVVRGWDVRTGALLKAFGGHTDAVQALACSPDGNLLLTGSDDHSAKVFQLRD